MSKKKESECVYSGMYVTMEAVNLSFIIAFLAR